MATMSTLRACYPVKKITMLRLIRNCFSASLQTSLPTLDLTPLRKRQNDCGTTDQSLLNMAEMLKSIWIDYRFPIH